MTFVRVKGQEHMPFEMSTALSFITEMHPARLLLHMIICIRYPVLLIAGIYVSIASTCHFTFEYT